MPRPTTRTIRHNGRELEFRFNRVRYGRKTFTWAEVRNGEEWIELGDPWPGINWPKADLLSAAAYSLGEMSR